ncbi:zinc transporter ZupT [Peptoniphilus equinus]|uniref:Zinc transporter ZupT n=1 Tax=Peptoniphilus equinus TaxID=3016343 RepID=A0ABY7QRU1_9FIRM|nr:zinc transporter ZupT [Peptoniphilus equinus]WBW49494.1 zinc transporter ZupT [Peptoniphilus equinus]
MTYNALIALFICTLAGLATLIGTLMIFFLKRTNTRFLSGALGFSAGSMIFISFIELMPVAMDNLKTAQSEDSAFIYAMGGFFLGMLLLAIIDKIIPEEENPHELSSIKHPHLTTHTDVQDSGLYRMGLMTALAISIHNFPEGVATFISSVQNPQLGVSIAVAIAVHNIPEGMSVAVPIYYATGSKSKAFLYAFISGIAEPIGGLFAYLVFFAHATPTSIGIIFAVVAGIMVFISFDELLPSAEEYGNHHTSLYGCVGGMAFMALSLYLL